MQSEKPPVARKRAGGFSRLYLPLVGVLFGLLSASSRAEAAHVYSFGVDYLRAGIVGTTTSFGNEEYQDVGVSVLDVRQGIDLGLSARLLFAPQAGNFVQYLDLLVCAEKRMGSSALIGLAGGVLVGFAGPGILGSSDLYGKVVVVRTSTGALRAVTGIKLAADGTDLFWAGRLGLEVSWER